jgi:RNA polymerase sigma-70 factor, ECF subfamily
MKDYELIEAFQNGDEFAFVGIYNRYKGAVYAFCLKMLNDSEQAQDCMQETYLRVYENRNRLLKRESFKSWLFTIARNQCLNRIRRNRKHVAFNDDVGSTCLSSDTPVTRMEKTDQIRFVRCYLDRLKLEYREVLILREYQNLSYEEIAAVTRSSISSVKSRLFKARKKFALLVGPVVNAQNESARGDEHVVKAQTVGAEMNKDE